MERQKVLVVPTRTTEIDNLPPLPDMQVEVHAIASSTEATILPEPVTWLDVMRSLLDGNEYNIVHFCGHLADQFLILANERIGIDGLVMMFRRSPAHRKLILFNTCDSVDAAIRIATATPCDVIYADGPIENEKAINFAIKFYSALRYSETYREAFDSSVGDEKNFGYVNGVGQASEEDSEEDTILRGGSSEVTLIRADLNELRILMTGGLRGNGLIWEMGELKEQYEALSKRVARFERFEVMLNSMYEASIRKANQKNILVYIAISILIGLAVGVASNYLRGG